MHNKEMYLITYYQKLLKLPHVIILEKIKITNIFGYWCIQTDRTNKKSTIKEANRLLLDYINVKLIN